eukprot:TRINITY_DN28556_c0_g1_i1.p1 TRINITY_DN28556_c0_g1~~TRINITY_DN28556_c0_g1_i1.p1  ORF type:complete len:437 (-),score=94.94 TRINITY_DN28556_c0_g1_i1:200-1510(-)
MALVADSRPMEGGAAASSSAAGEVSGRRGRWGRAARAAEVGSEATAAAETREQPEFGSSDAGLQSEDACDRQKQEETGAANSAGSRSTWRRGPRLSAKSDAEVEHVKTPTMCDVAPLTREGALRAGIGCTIRLRRGLKMPQMGLGGGGLEGNEGRDAVCAALQAGYRLIDTALFYNTEKDIAAGIKLAGLSRADVFISTKLLQKAHKTPEQVRASLMESLKNLGTNYVDLYLVHNPRAGKIKTVWKQLLELREQGLIRALGVSNFGPQQLEGMRLAGLEMPEVNQIEVHPWRQLPETVAYHEKHGIATMCMAPLARGQMFGRTDLAAIARDMGRTEAEVVVRWCLQKGYIPIPKSIQPERIVLNAANGFDLSEKVMARIAKLDTNYMSCKVASPCCDLEWELLADDIPDPSLWGGRKVTGSQKGGYQSRGNVFLEC